MNKPQYDITGEWMAADDSRNHLELARTAEPGVIAIRSTFWPKQTLFATTGQLAAVVKAVETGRLRELVTA